MLSASYLEPEFVEATGILAVGGDLSVTSLLFAYRCGAFPWYNESEPICWYHPNPRFVLFPHKLRISKSMKQFMRSTALRFSMNEDFSEVIRNCRSIFREKQGNNLSWIHDDVEEAFCNFHNAGYAISAEAWNGAQLVGGLYGVRLGNVFFGESMFAKESNASKFAFIKLIDTLKQEGLALVDCQTHTAHLESLGGEFITRDNFMQILDQEL